ncbi:hypothetical protein SmJEL517_g02631 [Synchytrium microbalum]|uniref:4-nitrophenylphosphatase n=1 Tax=Synchytrium microbalum TaxID=1806994 RepID=A0A507CA42_9FUNG|nr:uncharacterized protein SmJEL517_g02631 [Synchytrium microbalum]TPX34866.1 hypothetical protein SmJEL517_g02631 [Synchytrium microbalum]
MTVSLFDNSILLSLLLAFLLTTHNPTVQDTFLSSSQLMHTLESAADKQTFLDGVDTFLLDCDGVIWSGNDVFPNVHYVLDTLRSMGKRLLFVTNNSTKSRAAYRKKFTSLNLTADVDEIFGSSYAAAYYLKHILNFPDDKNVYICGMEGIQEELKAEEISYIGSSADDENLKSMDDMATILPDPSVGAVLFGFDLNINYKKLAKAFTYLHDNPSVHFVATNSDLTYPAGGRVYPGTGALLSALSASVGRKPIICGKPEQTMLDVIINKYHLNVERTCMVGDRLDTDIEFGKLGGLKTLLVMTGVTSKQELSTTHIIPDYVMKGLGELLPPPSN